MALNSGADTEIITLDLPAEELASTKMEIEEGEVRYVKKEVSGERFIGHPAASKIRQVFGDSASFDFSEYSNSIDVAFIDGSHAYEYVLNDSEKVIFDRAQRRVDHLARLHQLAGRVGSAERAL